MASARFTVYFVTIYSDKMKGFEYRENDPEGLDTLEAVAKAENFNRWMYEQVRPYLDGEILEIGSGIGNISSYFLEDGSSMTLSDIRENYCQRLESKFTGHKGLKGVLRMDLVDPLFREKFKGYENKFDGIFALNVIEHIKDDSLAMKNLNWMLKPGGTVVILVPAFNQLYNKLDSSLMHFRRYTVKTLELIFREAGIIPYKSWYFNSMGIPAWWLGGSLMKGKEIKGGQMDIYDKLIPLAKIFDSVFSGSLGLSVITAGRKKS